MIHHTCTNMCVKMNTKEKEAFKNQGYAPEQDTRKTIFTYFKELKNFKEKLDSRGIATSTGEMIIAAVS